MFVGGTTLLAQSYRPSERARAQGAAEMLRYAATALATLAAGPALDAFGWQALNAAMLPVVLAAGLMTWWWARAGPRGSGGRVGLTRRAANSKIGAGRNATRSKHRGFCRHDRLRCRRLWPTSAKAIDCPR